MTYNYMKALLPVSVFLFIMCSDPLSNNDRIVRTLISGPMQSGEYSVFWNGTDDHENLAEAGTYIAMLYTRNFTLIDTLTALAGTEKKDNRNEYYNTIPVLMDEMYDNEPDPFYIEDGTNIHFALSQDMSVQLTIQTPKNE
ncbi:hypothetical protein JW835_07935 [bacterium]|nr:hypothetical protein [bacterium]